MQPAIKPIETVYSGYRFRSRLEARWAVFFDTLGVPYEYEKEGYNIGQNRWYLPDFYLPSLHVWIEVKGESDALDFQLLADAIDWGSGLPEMTDSFGTSRGLLILGPIPTASLTWLPYHPILQHHKGGVVSLICFRPGGFDIVIEDLGYFDSSWGEQDGEEWVSQVTKYFPGGLGGLGLNASAAQSTRMAYVAARQARFEHGAHGR